MWPKYLILLLLKLPVFQIQILSVSIWGVQKMEIKKIELKSKIFRRSYTLNEDQGNKAV